MDDDLVELGSPSQKKRKTTNEVQMKPLKIENEVDSNMKSTIRYTFVAPGAIGKGRGQEFKSMGEKGKMPSKSLLPQSSDLIRKKGSKEKSESLSSSLGISKYDMGSFNKSVVCADQHMQTPSESTKSGSTFSSSQEM
ncbi:hypothetical protein H5410_003185 [Solanum commersonii]|uniref:Uncharacterized protein n=1 Tax=Solanum commersonii TaxID=4109 RepID=A0A9J6B4B7_SOLCO|nr:hypothetical protein H5410_003185 [Solanum commersonii]